MNELNPTDSSWKNLASGEELKELISLSEKLKNLPQPILTDRLLAKNLLAKNQTKFTVKYKKRAFLSVAAMFLLVVTVGLFAKQSGILKKNIEIKNINTYSDNIDSDYSMASEILKSASISARTVSAEKLDTHDLLIIAESPTDEKNSTEIYVYCYNFDNKNLQNISNLKGKYISHEMQNSELLLNLNDQNNKSDTKKIKIH